MDAVVAQNISWKKKSEPTEAYVRSGSASASPTGSSEAGAKAPRIPSTDHPSPGYIRLYPIK